MQANHRALGNYQTPASSTETFELVQYNKHLRLAATSLAMLPFLTAQYISHMTDFLN
jgi:hypothetical protein